MTYDLMIIYIYSGEIQGASDERDLAVSSLRAVAKGLAASELVEHVSSLAIYIYILYI